MGAVDSDSAATRAIGDTLMLAMAGITGRPGTEDDQS